MLTHHSVIILDTCSVPRRVEIFFALAGVAAARCTNRCIGGVENAVVLCVLACDGEDAIAYAGEPDIAFVKAIGKVGFECWAVEEREHAVEVVEIEVDERLCQLVWWPVCLQVRECARRCDV